MKVNSKPTVGEKTHKHTLKQMETLQVKRSTRDTSKSLKEGLSLFLSNNTDDDDDDSLCRTLKHRVKTTMPEKQKNTGSIMGNKLIPNQLLAKETRNAKKGEALQKAYAVAGRTYRTHQMKYIGHPTRRLQHPESDLCVAASRYNDDDSDSSSHQEGNLLSLFQSRLTLSKPCHVVAACHPSFESNPLSSITMENENNLRSKRLIFTSPLPKIDRHHKRRDRKKTPMVKFASTERMEEEKVIQAEPEPLMDVVVGNMNVRDGVYMEDDDTASSLSDDSILEQWKHPPFIAQKFLSPTECTSPIPPQSVKDTTMEVDALQMENNETMVDDVPLIDERVEDASSQNQIAVDMSEQQDRSTASLDIIEYNDECKRHSTCLADDPIANTSMHEEKSIRRSRRARTVTNRSTVVASDGQATKQQEVKRRQETRPKSISEPIDDHTSIQNRIKNPSNVKNRKASKDRTTGTSRTMAHDDVDRPKRNRKKTDFYHNTISLEEPGKLRAVVVTSPLPKPTVIRSVTA